MLLALATLEDWHIHQMDVKSVFLNGVLDEEIFMEQPQGFITTGSETQVCHLCKAICGLKQASRQWNLQFHGVLTGLGFKQTYADAGIYVCHQQEGDGPLFVILYVDDITILGASLQAVQRLKSDLSTRYKMSDLREIESYLGICVTFLPHMTSTSAIEKGKWLEWRDMPERTDSSGSNGPVEPDLDLDKEESFIVGRLVSADMIEHETDHAPDYGAYGVMSGRLALS
jgi:hypothetical protein